MIFHVYPKRMQLKQVLTIWALIWAGCWVLKAQEKSPNVVVIYTDDHRFSGVHALGGQAVQTPHLDQLVEEGVAFTRTYLMGAFSGATCIPSRAMLLTGRPLFELEGIGRTIPAAHSLMSEAFRAAGYHTHIVGKWHQDDASLARGFQSGGRIMGRSAYLVDHFRMPLWDWNAEGHYPREDAFLMTYNAAGKRVRRALSATDKRGPIGTEANGPHTSEIFADDAIEFIQSYERDRPYFMYLAFHAPHDPRQAPAAYRALYPPDEIKLPPSYLPQHPFAKADMTVRDEALAPWPRSPEIARQQLADYYAIITHLDAQIGRLIQALKASGQFEHTIILLAGDSGLAVGNHGLMGKQNVYDEDGLHVPLILAGGPVKGKGRRLPALSYIHDIFPTLCGLAGIEQPASVMGRSLLPVLEGSQSQVRTHSYHAYKQYERAYRRGDFKLIEFVRAEDASRQKGAFIAGSRVSLLFNITEDPWETTDLSWMPEYQDLLEEMRIDMRKQAEVLGDSAARVGQQFDFWDYWEQ